MSWWIADVWDCVVCGKPCDEVDDDGVPIHALCKADRDAMQAESREDR